MRSLGVLFFAFAVAIGSHSFITPAHSAESLPRVKPDEPLPAGIFVKLSKVMTPTVVNISTTSNPRFTRNEGRTSRDPFFDMFEQFMGPRGPARPQQGLGTGFIINPNGLILTNNHVIENADVIKVQLSEKDPTTYTAKVIGRDKRTDLALIKIDAKKALPAAKLGSSKDLQVGEWVGAFGNPLGLGHTMSKGIVSAIGREIGELNRFPFIQTDASINPGNSGGPLVNMSGEVIGVNSAIAANSQGIGFAIPIDEAKSVIEVLEKDGIIKRGYFGVNMYPYPVDPEAAQEMKLPSTEGALIVGVLPNSPAAKAGLKEYDFVTKFNGQNLTSSADLSRVIGDAEVGKKYKVHYIRKGQEKSVDITLEEHPDDKREVQNRKKSYQGQRAPFDLGFTVTNYTAELAKDLALPPLRRPYPVVTEIDYTGPAAKAGLGVGDIIVDVNRTEVARDVDVIKLLKNNQINSVRVIRGAQPVLLYINPNTPQ